MIGGGEIGIARAAADAGELLAKPRDDGGGRIGGVRALVEGLQRHDHEGGVRLRIIVDEIQADDRGIIGDRLFPLQYVLDLLDGGAGAPDRGGVGQLHHDEEGALVFFGQEARRRHLVQRENAEDRDRDHGEADDRDAHEPRNHGAIGVAHMVDAAHDHADRAAAGPVMRLQQDGAERRRQRQRVDRGEEHRHRDGDRELAEQFAGDARNERDGHENRQQTPA